jgi:hypothetical protein
MPHYCQYSAFRNHYYDYKFRLLTSRCGFQPLTTNRMCTCQLQTRRFTNKGCHIWLWILLKYSTFPVLGPITLYSLIFRIFNSSHCNHRPTRPSRWPSAESGLTVFEFWTNTRVHFSFQFEWFIFHHNGTRSVMFSDNFIKNRNKFRMPYQNRSKIISFISKWNRSKDKKSRKL